MSNAHCVSFDGAIYQILFTTPPQPNDDAHHATTVQVRRAFFSGGRLLPKPPKESTLAGPHGQLRKKLATVNAVADLSLGRTVVLVADLVTDPQHHCFLNVYQLRTATQTLTPVVSLPLPVSVEFDQLSHVTVSPGPTISCVVAGNVNTVYVYSPHPVRDHHVQRQDAWLSKDHDSNVVAEADPGQDDDGDDHDGSGAGRSWHRTAFRAHGTGGRWTSVAASGCGPLVFQEVQTTSGATGVVAATLVVGAGHRSPVQHVAGLLQSWCRTAHIDW